MSTFRITNTGTVFLDQTEDDNIDKATKLDLLNRRAKEFGFPTIADLEAMAPSLYKAYAKNQQLNPDLNPEILLSKLVKLQEKAEKLKSRRKDEEISGVHSPELE